MKVNPLTEKISKHFSLHPSRQNTMAAMIFSVLCSNNVHHQSLARYVDSPNPKAALRKVERFFFVMKRYPPRSTQRQSLVRSDSKESLTLALIEAIGNMAKGKSITWS